MLPILIAISSLNLLITVLLFVAPRAVWRCSFNFTKTAAESFENALCDATSGARSVLPLSNFYL